MQTNRLAVRTRWLAALALSLAACGGTSLGTVEPPAGNGGSVVRGSTGSDGGSSQPSNDGGLGLPVPGIDPGSTAGKPPSNDAGAPTSGTSDAGSTTGSSTGSTGTSTGTTTAKPSFGSWAWGAPDVTAVAHAGFNWFEGGYPGTLSASDTAYLTAHGTTPFAYINMSEVPNTDSYLQGQIGSFWSSISLCQNTSWNTTVVDVRDPRWQDWLERRANAAYDLGNRGIKWDVAGVEGLCNSWSGQGSAAPQQAIDAMVKVLSDLKAQHPDFKFIVNQGFALAEQHPELIDGFELENMINYADANPNDSWATETIAEVSAIHTNGHIPIFDLEYYDLFGCSDTTCSQANTIFNQVMALDWVPYITVVDMNVEGRGLNISPPW